jgi:hypothetical protein
VQDQGGKLVYRMSCVPSCCAETVRSTVTVTLTAGESWTVPIPVMYLGVAFASTAEAPAQT